MACTAVEILVVLLALWPALFPMIWTWCTTGRRRRSAGDRRATAARLNPMVEIDASLDEFWGSEVRVRRDRAEADAVRLITEQMPIVEVRYAPSSRTESCAQLLFADGTALAFWPASRSSVRGLCGIAATTVLAFAPGKDCSAWRFGAGAEEISINGNLLAMGSP